MVSTLSLIFMVVTALLALALPVVLIIYFWIKTRFDPITVAFGGVAFYFAQVMVKMGILTSSSQSQWFITISKYPILTGIFFGILGGVLCEITRILCFMFLIKKEDRNWKNSLGYGIGYGGIESIMMVGMAFLSYIGYSIAINNGYFDTQIGIQFTAEQAASIKADLMQPAYIYLLAGIERVVLMIFQVALSMIVMYGVAEGQPVYFGYAFLAHIILTVPMVLLGQIHQIVGIAWLLVVGYYALKIIRKAKTDLFKEPQDPVPHIK